MEEHQAPWFPVVETAFPTNKCFVDPGHRNAKQAETGVVWCVVEALRPAFAPHRFPERREGSYLCAPANQAPREPVNI